MKRTERMRKRQEHADAFKQGWDECEAFYAKVISQMQPDDVTEVEVTDECFNAITDYVHGELIKEGFAPMVEECKIVVHLVIEAMYMLDKSQE